MIQMASAARSPRPTATNRSTNDAAALARLLAPVAWRIHIARRDRQMTVRALARSARFRPATVRGFETGARPVSAAAISRLAEGLGVDEEELYPGGRPEAFWARVGDAMREFGGTPCGVRDAAAPATTFRGLPLAA